MSDYNWIEIDGFDTINGVEVPYHTTSTGRHYLDWTEIRGQEAKELTSPYGCLEFAVGSGDDFHCFDYAKLPDGRIVIHSVINSETGGFIGTAGYYVVRPEEAVGTAIGCIDDAIEWLRNGGTPLRHDQRGWNQDPHYFARSVARYVGDPRIAWWKGARVCKPRRRSSWIGEGQK
jgi:hypothetical protein